MKLFKVKSRAKSPRGGSYIVSEYVVAESMAKAEEAHPSAFQCKILDNDIQIIKSKEK